MPPRRKKTPKAPPPPAEPEDEFFSMSADELRSRVDEQESQLQELRDARVFAQLERDRVAALQRSSQRESRRHEAEKRILASRVEKLGNLHRNNMRLLEQRLKHIEFRAEQQVKDLEEEVEQLSKQQDAQYHNSELQAQQQKCQNLQLLQAATEAAKERQKRVEEEFRKERDAFAKQMQKETVELEDELAAREAEITDELELSLEVIRTEMEERFNIHIARLASNHGNAFENLRSYYNQITRDNLALIKALRKEIADLDENYSQNDESLRSVSVENRQLEEPLRRAEQRYLDLKKKLQNFDIDKASLERAKRKIRRTDQEISKLRESTHDKQHELKSLQQKQRTMARSIEIVSTTNTVLKAKITEYESQLRQKHRFLAEVVETHNLDVREANRIAEEVSSVLETKRTTAEELQLRADKLTKAHDDLIALMSSRLAVYGISMEEYGLKPIVKPGATSDPSLPTQTTMPSGFAVSSNA
ncbi:MAG: hypothetical protein MHM6MM_001494 [Cercozoa sp. M6MM]